MLYLTVLSASLYQHLFLLVPHPQDTKMFFPEAGNIVKGWTFSMFKHLWGFLVEGIWQLNILQLMHLLKNNKKTPPKMLPQSYMFLCLHKQLMVLAFLHPAPLPWCHPSSLPYLPSSTLFSAPHPPYSPIPDGCVHVWDLFLSPGCFLQARVMS